MKNLGILLDMRSPEQVLYAQDVCEKAVGSNNVKDYVIFYTRLCRLEKPFNTSILSINHLWSFSGNLILLSSDKLLEIKTIPSNIEIIYVPDTDENFDALKLLCSHANVKIKTMRVESKSLIDRTIGDNIPSQKYSSLETLIGDIT